MLLWESSSSTPERDLYALEPYCELFCWTEWQVSSISKELHCAALTCLIMFASMLKIKKKTSCFTILRGPQAIIYISTVVQHASKVIPIPLDHKGDSNHSNHLGSKRKSTTSQGVRLQLGNLVGGHNMGWYWCHVMTPRLHSLYILKQLNCVHQEHQELEGATFWNYVTIYLWFDLLPLTSYPICWVKTFQRLWHCRLSRLESCHGLVSLHHWGKLVLLSCVTLHKK